MRLIIDIKDNKASAFLNFIKSLDFISIQKQDKDFILSNEQKDILNERRVDYLKDTSKSYSWEEVKANARQQRK